MKRTFASHEDDVKGQESGGRMVSVVEDLGMDVVLDYSNLLEVVAGVATAGVMAMAMSDDHNHLVATIMEDQEDGALLQ
jgi:NADH:ubiquinone oxidoreductase subunit F (NADH-binding)